MTPETFLETVGPIFKPILAGIVGALFVGFIAHLLTKDRDKRHDREAREHADAIQKSARRRDFIGDLKKWRTEIASPNPATVIGGYYGQNLQVAIYQGGLAVFHKRIELVRNDFADSQRFDALTKKVCGLKQNDSKHKQPSEIILEAIDELIHFVEN